MLDKYQLFLDSLTKAKNKKWIIPLYRGVSKKFAFEKVNLDINYNTLDQFAKRLFFYGEKSKYFWNDKINPIDSQLNFDINDISDSFFEYIFQEFNLLIDSYHYNRTGYYFNKNKKAIFFFKNIKNLPKFIFEINKETDDKKKRIRNYYLTTLHQLGESKYKQTSQFVSGSTDETVANKFSKDEIVINFWELNFNKENIIQTDIDVPLFKGKPYKNQKELSVFTVILPQFIYSFIYNGKTYINPAIYAIADFEIVPLSGLDIRQDNIAELLTIETNYSKGVTTDGSTYQEI